MNTNGQNDLPTGDGQEIEDLLDLLEPYLVPELSNPDKGVFEIPADLLTYKQCELLGPYLLGVEDIPRPEGALRDWQRFTVAAKKPH